MRWWASRVRVLASWALVVAGACPALAACSGPDASNLLRSAAVTSLEPVAPPLRTLFSAQPCDPTLHPVLDLEVTGFTSGAAFPHDAGDLDPSLPLVFYQLTTPTKILHVGKQAGRVVLTFADDAATTFVMPPPGGGAMIGGARSAILLHADGSVWCWGADFSFKMGQGNAVQADQYLPVQVHGPANAGFLGDVSAVAGGEPFNLALASDGTAWAWGDNQLFGELGIGDMTITNSNVPVQVLGTGGAGTCLQGLVSVASRGYHALALAGDGTVYGWGMNGTGECGNGATSSAQPLPVQVQGLPSVPIVQINAAYGDSFALLADGTVWGWGSNNKGQMGNGTFTTPQLSPAVIGAAVGLSGIVQVSAGWTHVLALRSDGTVWAWGGDDYGQLGDGGLSSSPTPLQVKGPGGAGVLSDVVMVSGGDCSSAALRADGTVWTWGCNHHNGTNPPPNGQDPVGQLGNGDNTYQDQPYPVQVVGGDQGGPFLQGIVIVAARDYHCYALARDGSLYSWGSNLNGQLGTGSCCLPSTVPVRVHLP